MIALNKPLKFFMDCDRQSSKAAGWEQCAQSSVLRLPPCFKRTAIATRILNCSNTPKGKLLRIEPVKAFQLASVTSVSSVV
jgi:hypothetical protein